MILFSKKSMSLSSLILIIFSFGCSSSFLKYKNEKTFFKNEEFEQQVKIETVTDTEVSSEENKDKNIKTSAQQKSPVSSSEVILKKPISKIEKNTPSKTKLNEINKNKIQNKKSEVNVLISQREPEIEDNENFINSSRRPNQMPFRPGEILVHQVSYFGAAAGQLTFEVKPYANVNNKKTYQFHVSVKSSSFFSTFYSVDDNVNTFLGYEDLLPYVLKIDIKESKKLAQSQTFFDHVKNKAHFWEKKFTDKDGEEIKKYTWDILPFSQNAYSGFYYMRIFDWKVGKEISFRVAEDQKNVIFKGTAIKMERLSTEAGNFMAYKIKADIITRGALSKKGNIFIWISADERKYILKIEADIKIGTLVSEVIKITPGPDEN